MTFASELFIFFFMPLVLLLCILGRNVKINNGILLAASLIFYSWGGIGNCLLLLISIGLNYMLGNYVRGRKSVLCLAVIYNIAVLGVFKYTGLISAAQPIGISFFTFSILSYIIDVYYGKVKAQKNIFNLGLYVLLFPKVMSGPIVRYIDIEKEITDRTIDTESIYNGMRRFCCGFVKKVLFANEMSEMADTAFSYQWGLHPVFAWLGAVSYMLYIYLDFSAYSDMAIGLGNMFGFHFGENFNYPYISTSIKEFWRRWHISLSSWFRDYVYIPLGGNRKGNLRTYLNLLIVFFLTGLWHGASLNFIVWGLYHGFFLLIERLTGFCSKIPRWLAWVYSMLVVIVGWIFFKTESLGQAMRYIGYMFGFQKGSLGNLEIFRKFDLQYIIFFIISVLISFPLMKRLISGIKINWIKDIGILILFFVAICYMAASDYNPFIYFRF